jgi:protein arginine N-methyltransferase 1
MNNNGSETPAGITSSADRMVGMEHSEVRYFTRYDVLTVSSEFGC